ncbi:MAG: DUF1585 domain-containing protein, partial [Planctomycetota bacterium]
ALENFDAIGGRRVKYQNNLPIDSAGRLPGGDRFTNLEEFREVLSRRQPQFNRCLTEKLMTYALGRELDIGDRPSIDLIVQQIEDDSRGLQDLIRSIVKSESFGRN